MTPDSLRSHIDAYLELRRSLGFRTPAQAHHLRELLDYVIAQGFAWPIRTQTILDWISAAGSVSCGLPGQRMRLINARCFLKHLKASAPDTEVPDQAYCRIQHAQSLVCTQPRRSLNSNKSPLSYGNPARYGN